MVKGGEIIRGRYTNRYGREDVRENWDRMQSGKQESEEKRLEA